MPEYTESVVQATVSTRAFAAHISFPRGQPAGQSIVFEEERVSVVAGKATKAASGSVGGQLVLAATFPVINPSTGVPTGATATHLQLLVLLASLYGDFAAKRDAALPP